MKDMEKNYKPNSEEEFNYLRYFEGKVCSVLLRDTVTWHGFDSRQFADYFVGHVDFVGMIGVWTTNVITKGRNFYRWEHIAAIVEEQFVSEDDPAYEEIKEQAEKQKTQKAAPQVQPVPQAAPVPEWLSKNDKRVNVDALTDIAKQAKE